MEETGVARRQHHYQQHLQVVRPHTVVNRLTRESSGECVSSSDDELAGETHFEARVGVLCRKKSSRVQFEDPAERILQLQGDQLKLKKKDKIKAKIFVYYVWVRRNISDYVPRESHRLKDENLAVIAGWYKDLMIVTFNSLGEKESFLLEFQRINQETVHSLYKEHAEPSEQCQVSLGTCISVTLSASAGSVDTTQTISVKHYETANDVARKCKVAFKLDPSLRAQVWLEGSSGYSMVGCESIFSTVLYEIHDRHKTTNRRRGSILSEASSNSPNESNSMELDETVGREATVQLSLHLQDSCVNASCATRKKKPHHHQLQLRRTSEVPSKIRNWIASNNRRSQLIRHGSVETLTASNGGGVACEPSPIIGRPLAELYPSGIVSRPVTCLLAQIYHRCYAARGIFRQPGSVSEKNQVLQLLSHYDLNSKGDNMKQLNDFGEHCIADALKHYLRNLPGCLLQSNLSSQWINIVRNQADPTPKVVAQQIRSVIQTMQPQNAHLLHMLMATLRRVADHHAQNQMTAANIGTSVSFSVLELSPQGSSLEAMEQEAQWVNKLIELMIANYSEIWPDEVENETVRADFVRHICQHDDLSSMESLITDGARQTDVTTEPLSLSSLSKDSGLQLSDQQLDDNRRGTSVPLGITIVPERAQPPPYDIAVKRQERSHRSRNTQQQLPPEPPAPITPRRERPPVPARLHKRPSSVGPSGRQPLPGAASVVETANGNGNKNGSTDSSVSNGNMVQLGSSLAGSRTRHPLSTTDGRLPVAPPPQPPQSSTRPVRGVASVAAATAAAAAAAATQPPPAPQPQIQPRFRKRSSSETRLDLIGHGPSPLPTGPQKSSNLPFYQHHHEFQQPRDAAARQRRQEFERLSRLHNRDSFDSAASPGTASVAAFSARTPFSSRHAPIRGGANYELVGTGPRQPRPRTRLPEALQRKLADQPESLV